MKATPTSLPGVISIKLATYPDDRGVFYELYQQNNYKILNIAPFVQQNYFKSKKAALRGLHYQLQYPQGKLVSVIKGEILDVAVDIRVGSPHFGKILVQKIADNDATQLYIPPGFAHGVIALSDEAHVVYHCTELYHPEDEKGIAYNDPALKIDWQFNKPIVSGKDRQYPTLSATPNNELPQFKAN